MNRIAHFIVHRHKVILGLTALITLLSIAMLFRMSFNGDVASFIAEGNETGEEFSALQDKYETSDPINVVATLPDGGTFTVATRQNGDQVELRFSDTGPGVPEELRERIFEPFFSHGKREGAGLGLSIARRIVEEHGGRLWIEGGKEEGATFVLSLPL